MFQWFRDLVGVIKESEVEREKYRLAKVSEDRLKGALGGV